MTQPAQSVVPEQSIHTGKASTRQNLGVGHSVFRGFGQVTADVSQVEGVKYSLVSGILVAY